MVFVECTLKGCPVRPCDLAHHVTVYGRSTAITWLPPPEQGREHFLCTLPDIIRSWGVPMLSACQTSPELRIPQVHSPDI